MRTVAAVGLGVALVAANGAWAAPRGQYAPIYTPGEVRTPGLPKPEPFRPYKPPKPYSIYGDDPTSLAPRANEYESPYLHRYRGESLRERDSLAPSNKPPTGPGFEHRYDGLPPQGGTFAPRGGTLRDRRPTF